MPISTRAGLSMHDQLLLRSDSRVARDPPEAQKNARFRPNERITAGNGLDLV
jgi:hypothetical protein